jgi:hypothetical protein
MKQQIRLQVKSDSIGTLMLLNKLRTSHKSAGMSLIAREMALLFGSCCYKPRLLSHIPGVGNDWADALSRIHQPSNKKAIPSGFLQCTKMTSAARTRAYYETLVAASQDS